MPHNPNKILVVKGVVVVLLLLCLIDADYGFYQALRTLISFGLAFITYSYYQEAEKKNAIIYLCLLIIFQPLIRIGLGRDIWILVDVLVAGYLIFQILTSLKGENKKTVNNSTSIESQKPKQSKTRFENDAERIRKKW